MRSEKRGLWTGLAVALVMAGLGVTAFSAHTLCEYEVQNRISDRSNARAVEIAASHVNAAGSEDKAMAEQTADIAAMQAVNPDTVGLLLLQGQVLPVVQAEDCKKYLTTGWDGSETACGTIFMDSGASEDVRNIILYGHHMKSGRMFGELDKYLSREYRNELPTFTWVTEGNINRYEVAAVIRANVSDIEGLLGMELTSDIEELSEKAEESGMLYEDLSPEYEYMSLITCEYEHEDGRLVVIGRSIENSEEQNRRESQQERKYI